MWIQTQNKQRIVNSDHIIDIFISVRGNEIYAETEKKEYIYPLENTKIEIPVLRF